MWRVKLLLLAPTLYGLIRSINVLGESLGSSLISVLLKRLRFFFFLYECLFYSGEENKA